MKSIPQLCIGWASRDISPKPPCDLAGQFYRRVATQVRDELRVTAVAMEPRGASQARQQLVMVSLDLIDVPMPLLRRIRQAVRARVDGLDVRRIIISATHTHTAPLAKPPKRWIVPPDGHASVKAYIEYVVGQTAEAIREAWGKRKAGYVGSALGYARIGHCRRCVFADGSVEMYGRTDRPDFVGLEAGEDSGLETLFCWDTKKRLAGILVNVACPSQVLEAGYQVSADFMGEARRQLKERYGQHVHVLPQISAAGDQAPRDLARNDRGAEPDMWRDDGAVELGRRIADGVEAVYERAAGSMRQRLEVEHVVKTVKLPVWRMSDRDVRHATRELRRLRASLPTSDDPAAEAFEQFVACVRAKEATGGPGPYDDKFHSFVVMREHQAVIDRHRDQDEQSHVPMELHVVRIGDVMFATNPFELFLDYGSRIKARSPARQTFLIQLACGSHGYLPTANAICNGGYGATAMSVKVGSEGGEKLVHETVKSLQRLWKKA